MGNSCTGKNRVQPVNINPAEEGVDPAPPSPPIERVDFEQQCYDGRSMVQLGDPCKNFEQQVYNSGSRPTSRRPQRLPPGDEYDPNDMVMIVNMAKSLEKILRENHGSTGSNLWELLASVNVRLSRQATDGIHQIRKQRNLLVHELDIDRIEPYARRNLINYYEAAMMELRR